MVLSGLSTVASFLLLSVMLKDSAMDGLLSIAAFTDGNSLGTFFAMKRA
jgi:hypothetical protein